MKFKSKYSVGAVVIASLLCGSMLSSQTAFASETVDSANNVQTPSSATVQDESDGGSNNNVLPESPSEDTPDTVEDEAEVPSQEESPISRAVTSSNVDISKLKSTLENTTEEKLHPLASGYRSDDSGTAPYDRVSTNKEDIKKLSSARDEAQKIVANADVSQEEVDAATAALQKAFDGVRFIYHYTAITGTNGSRIFDNNGNLIQAHGAGIQKIKTTLLNKNDQKIDENKDGYVYAWCGEDKTDRLVAHGVRIYYSDDLYNWVDKGLGFQTYLGDADLAEKQSGSDATYQKYYNVENIAKDPDYTTIYGKDFSAFANDSANYNISSAQQALDKLLWDLKALKGTGEDASQTSAVFERPKMAYNEATHRWVIWFHADGPKYGNENTATYSKAKAGVAISEGSDPAGPYKYLGSFRMSPGNNAENPGMARDMNLYIDQGKDANKDGVTDAYLIYSSNENRDLTISLLDKTYTKLVKPVSEQKKGTDASAGDTYNIAATNSKESPAPFKWNNKYYIIYSETTGWAPNENKYTISESDSILGPYHEAGTPFEKGNGPNQDPSTSFTTQSSSVIPYDEEKGLFIYWGDRWYNPDSGNDISQSRYVMTPMQLVNGKLRVLPAADWTLEDMKQYEAVDVLTELPSSTGSMSDLMKALPTQLQVKVGGNKSSVTTPVTWNTYFGPDQPTGTVTVTGKLSQLHNTPVSFVVTIYPKNTVLFMDAGSGAANESDYYMNLRNVATLMNTNKDHSDQAYVKGQWGIVSTVGGENEESDVSKYETENSGIYDTGYWAKSGKSIVYQADLPAGTYTTQAGYKEWWSNKRQTVFTVSGVSEDGSVNKTFGEVSIVPAGNGNATDAVQFTLDKNSTVRFSTISKGGGDPLLSWISVNKVSADQIVSVDPIESTAAFLEGSVPSLPQTVTVNTADGSHEQKKVTWLFNKDDKYTSFALSSVQGVVEGTSLPAVASVQQIPLNLEYFVDVNGLDDSGNSSASYRSAASLSEAKGNKLLNSVADQKYDSEKEVTWGNASSNFGSKSAAQADPFESGIFAGANGTADTLSYVLTLAPGEHTVSFGMHDWWSQTRPTDITYEIAGDTKAASQKMSLASIAVTGGQKIASGKVTIPGDSARLVTFTLSSSAGTGPVLSWISSTATPADDSKGDDADGNEEQVKPNTDTDAGSADVPASQPSQNGNTAQAGGKVQVRPLPRTGADIAVIVLASTVLFVASVIFVRGGKKRNENLL